MHASREYPVKSTWLKAIEVGNFNGWRLLSVNNLKKYYPETVKAAKGHINYTRKNVHSIKIAGKIVILLSQQYLEAKKSGIYTSRCTARARQFTWTRLDNFQNNYIKLIWVKSKERDVDFTLSLCPRYMHQPVYWRQSIFRSRLLRF